MSCHAPEFTSTDANGTEIILYTLRKITQEGGAETDFCFILLTQTNTPIPLELSHFTATRAFVWAFGKSLSLDQSQQRSKDCNRKQYLIALR